MVLHARSAVESRFCLHSHTRLCYNRAKEAYRKTKKHRDLEFAEDSEAIRDDHRRNHKQALRVFFMAVSQAMGKMGTSDDSNSNISYNHTKG